MASLDVVEIVDVVADGQLGFAASSVVLVIDELGTELRQTNFIAGRSLEGIAARVDRLVYDSLFVVR